jgi:hypothetical protein
MYDLADGEARAKAYPASFHIPDAVSRYTFVPGCWVKLAFEDPENNHRGERMWVKVTGPGSVAGTWVGTLDNMPTMEWGGLVYGDNVYFEPKNVLDIMPEGAAAYRLTL